MAKCDYCQKEMKDPATTSCTPVTISIDGADHPQIPYAPEDPTRRCHDCGVESGGLHHPGCDMEKCPKCGGQLISCGCMDDEEE